VVIASVSISGVLKTPIRRIIHSTDITNSQHVRVVPIHRDTWRETKTESSPGIDVVKAVRSLPVDWFLQTGLARELDRLSDMHRAVVVAVRLR